MDNNQKLTQEKNDHQDNFKSQVLEIVKKEGLTVDDFEILQKGAPLDKNAFSPTFSINFLNESHITIFKEDNDMSELLRKFNSEIREEPK